MLLFHFDWILTLAFLKLKVKHNCFTNTFHFVRFGTKHHNHMGALSLAESFWLFVVVHQIDLEIHIQLVAYVTSMNENLIPFVCASGVLPHPDSWAADLQTKALWPTTFNRVLFNGQTAGTVGIIVNAHWERLC